MKSSRELTVDSLSFVRKKKPCEKSVSLCIFADCFMIQMGGQGASQ